MKKLGKFALFGTAAVAAWTVWRGSVRRQATEAWERAFLREGLEGPGYAPPQNLSRIVFLGDSLTQAWPLADLLKEHDIRNAGRSGDLFSQMRERWRATVLAHDAGVLHLLGGTNNITRGYSLGFMQREMGRLEELARVSRMHMIIGLLPPMRGTRARLNEQVRQMNAWLQTFAREHGIVVADYYTPLADDSGELRAEYAMVLPDGKLDSVHLNDAAYKAMAQVAQEAIREVNERRLANATQQS